MNKVILDIRKELKKNVEEKYRVGSMNFFKEKIKPYGVRAAVVHRISKEHFKIIKNESKKFIFSLCEKLWRSGYIEESFIVGDWSYAVHEQFEPADMKVFERWVKKYITNWASCDTFCTHTLGAFIEKYPQYIKTLKSWTKSKNRWVKRAAAVSLIIPAKRGMFLKEVFVISNILLIDPDDMVQKGYGWLLKEASRKHQKEVFNYVVKHKRIMPRTSLRYAIEKMPQAMRNKAMAK